MTYRYDYETIDGREVLVGGQAGPGMPVPLPGPESMKDESGRHRWVRGEAGAPVLSPVGTKIEDEAAKERKQKIETTMKDLATAIVDEGLTVADVIGKLKTKTVEVRRG